MHAYDTLEHGDVSAAAALDPPRMLYAVAPRHRNTSRGASHRHLSSVLTLAALLGAAAAVGASPAHALKVRPRRRGMNAGKSLATTPHHTKPHHTTPRRSNPAPRHTTEGLVLERHASAAQLGAMGASKLRGRAGSGGRGTADRVAMVAKTGFRRIVAAGRGTGGMADDPTIRCRPSHASTFPYPTFFPLP